MLILLNYFLLAVQSAPVGSADPTVDLTDVTERAKTLVQKILTDIPVAHAIAVSAGVSKVSGWLPQVLSDWLLVVKAGPCSPQGLTLESSQPTNLQVMLASLGLPTPPLLKPPSEHFTLVSLYSGRVCVCVFM